MQTYGRVNAEMVRRGLPPLEMGIGTNTGEIVASARRSEPSTASSAATSTTGRTESYTVGGQIPISEGTRQAAEPAVHVGQELEVFAKGFSAPLRAYEVVSLAAPHHLALPAVDEDWTTLPELWPVQFAVLDGKHVRGALRAGALGRLSANGAILCTSEPPALLTNLKVVLQEDDGDPVEAYAKVVGTTVENGTVLLRFTALTAAADLLRTQRLARTDPNTRFPPLKRSRCECDGRWEGKRAAALTG